MAATSAERLRERFERDGHVELGLHPAKVAVHLVLLVVLPVAVVLVAATGGRLVLALALVLVGWFLVAAGARYAEQLFGSGPALRLDRRGLTLRRWREPLVLEWTEVCSLLPYRPRRLAGPLVAILLSQWVWHDYRAARPVALRRIDRLTRVRKPYLVPLKVLDASAADILALAELQADLGPGAEVLFAGDVPR